jgi:hypothetical protein
MRELEPRVARSRVDRSRRTGEAGGRRAQSTDESAPTSRDRRGAGRARARRAPYRKKMPRTGSGARQAGCVERNVVRNHQSHLPLLPAGVLTTLVAFAHCCQRPCGARRGLASARAGRAGGRASAAPTWWRSSRLTRTPRSSRANPRARAVPVRTPGGIAERSSAAVRPSVSRNARFRAK